MAPKKDLLPLPGYSQGVLVNAAQRMKTMNQPICPNSRIEYERDRDGRLVPKEKGPDTQNCQRTGPGWVERCIALGHNPYFRTRVWYTPQDILVDEIGPDGKPTGALIKTGERLIKNEVTEPNTAQVAISIRINNGKGVEEKRKLGFRSLEEAGYQEVCQFRNCQKPVTPAGTSRRYGAYCTLEHLQLIAADAESIMLTQGAVLPVDHRRAMQKREHQLREISVGAVN